MNRNEIETEILALYHLLESSDNKTAEITESLVNTMQDATAVNFISKFIGWLRTAVTAYGELIRQRAEWRARLAELEDALEAAE